MFLKYHVSSTNGKISVRIKIAENTGNFNFDKHHYRNISAYDHSFVNVKDKPGKVK